MLLKESFHHPIASEKPYIPTFNPDLLGQVIEAIQQPRIARAMKSIEDPGRVIQGEANRLRMLSGAFHPDFYHKPIALLLACGAIAPGYSLAEVGPSLGGHLPQMPKDLQPGSMIGFDNQSHIVEGAREALKVFREASLLNSHKYEIVFGDHDSSQGLKADIAVSSLASQYEGGIKIVEWLMKHILVAGINGDVIHTPSEIFQRELDSRILPIRCSRLPFLNGYTGVGWELQGEPETTPFGKVYNAAIILDDAVYNEQNGVMDIPQPGAELEGKATVFEGEEGKLYVEGWAWKLTGQATEEDRHNLVAIKTTFNELYSRLSEATQYARVWEAQAGLGIPVYAAESGYRSAVMFNMATRVAKKSGMLPLAIIMRNGGEVRQIAEAGLFSQIGPGKAFQNLGELYKTMGGYLSDPQRFWSIVDYYNPMLATSITTPHAKIFEDIIRSAA